MSVNESALDIEDVLERDGVYVSTTVGKSMYPLLKNRRDTVIITATDGKRLKKYDVPLYRRGDDYVLHRIVKVKDDSYVILGDNCERKEYGITDAQIIGYLSGMYRREKYVSTDGKLYRAYAVFWYSIYPIRRLFMVIKRKTVGVIHRLCRLFRGKKNGQR